MDLTTAIRRDDADAVGRWLDDGGNVDAVIDADESPLTLAARNRAARVVDLLLARGARPDLFGVWPSALVHAVEAGDEAIVQRLLETGADVGSEPWHEDADLPLWSAVHSGRWDIALRLMDAGAVEKADPRWLGEVLSAALAARGKQRTAVIAAFATRLLHRFAETPLPIDDHLLQKAATSLKRAEATRAVGEQLAACVDEARAVEEEVIDLYAEQERLGDAMNVLRACPPSVRTRVAASFLPWIVDESVVSEVLALAGDEIDRPDPMGRTALMYAAHNGNLALVRTLVERGADIRRIEPTDGYSVLEYAWLGGPKTADAFAFILDRLHATAAEADARPETLDLSHYAVEAASERRWDRVEELLARGADVNGRDAIHPRRGRTLLAHALWQGNRERVLWLVEHGADLEAQGLENSARQADDGTYTFFRQLRRKIRNAPDVTLIAEGIRQVVDLEIGKFNDFGGVSLHIEDAPPQWPLEPRVPFMLRCAHLDIALTGEMSVRGPDWVGFALRDLSESQTAQLTELKRILEGGTVAQS